MITEMERRDRERFLTHAGKPRASRRPNGGRVMKQQYCANCDYYSPKYNECEHPDQAQAISFHRVPDDGSECELWEYGGEPKEDKP